MGDLHREARAIELLEAEYRKENMNNMAVEGVQGGFFQRRDAAAVRAMDALIQGTVKLIDDRITEIKQATACSATAAAITELRNIRNQIEPRIPGVSP